MQFSERIPVVEQTISTSGFRFMQLERCGEDFFDGSTREDEGTTLLGLFLLTIYTSYISATLTEVFPCFFLSCKANARVKSAKTGHGPHSFRIFVLFYV
jgi:hypothetical protein